MKTLSGLDFDSSRSLKVKFNSAIELPTYGFLLMLNGYMWPHQAPLRDIRLRNLYYLDFDLSRSLGVKCDSASGLPICGFIWMVNRT